MLSEEFSGVDGSVDVLREMRKELFEQLAALAVIANMNKAQPLIRRFRALETAIETADQQPDTSKYGRYKRAREAILDCLDGIGHAVDQEVIVDDLVANGFRRGKKGVATDVKKAIGFHLDNPRGIKAAKIRRGGNNLVGRYEWTDDKFQ